jgi:hypothetical protein
MNMPVLNFHKMTDMHKGYLCILIFWFYYLQKKPRIDVCVVCPYCALKESSDLLHANTKLCSLSHFCNSS